MDIMPKIQQNMELLIDFASCSGCQSCIIACSLAKAKVFSLTRGRISIIKIEDKCQSVPIVCEHCDDPPCIAACPVSAIRKGEDGILRVNHSLCTGCRRCSLVCRFGPETIKFIDNKAYLCDLCDGKPKCVSICQQRALIYLPRTQAVVAKKKELSEKRRMFLESLHGA
jgi:Fe-S-cluster-containing dehydrogenase component